MTTLIEALIAIGLGAVGIIQLIQQTKLKQAEVTTTKVEASAARASADAEKARAEAAQANAAANTIQSLTTTLSQSIKEATQERHKAEEERQKHFEFLQQQLVIQERSVAAVQANTDALQSHSVVMKDVDERLGKYAEDNRKQITQIINVGRSLENQLSAARDGLTGVTAQVHRLPAEIEEKISPLIERLTEMLRIIELANDNVTGATDAIRSLRLGLKEDFDALEKAIVQSIKGENPHVSAEAL